MRLMVYSHDAFGLGNLRRMLSICEFLLENSADLSILLISGSPMLHAFRLPKGLDYIKLPCLNRGQQGELSAKYLGTDLTETVQLRSQLIYDAALHFRPDLLLVDKKPTGIEHELDRTLDYLQQHCPATKMVLLLRDILDSPAKTIAEWHQYDYYQTIQSRYDQVLVVGMPEVFDIAQEYQFPLPLACKVCYCGYIRKAARSIAPENLRRMLRIAPAAPLVLVTPGGGEDGFPLVESYLKGLQTLSAETSLRSMILCGPEMPLHHQATLQKLALQCPGADVQIFTDQLLGYLESADLVVSMGGYNTLTEVLSLGKKSVVVPRVQPSQEQWIRAQRFMARGWVRAIHPESITPRSLIQTVLEELNALPSPSNLTINFNGLPQISHCLSELGNAYSPTLLNLA